MTRKIFRIALVLACLVGVKTAHAEFKDIRIDLTNAAYLTAEEGVQNEKLSMGFVIADDGTPSRVAADDAAANIVLSGKFHSNEHGWGNFSSTVAVEGPVKISMGTCAWGGDVTVKNGSETVGSFNTNTSVCYHNDKTANIASFYLQGRCRHSHSVGWQLYSLLCCRGCRPLRTCRGRYRDLQSR